jgi:two-component system chemotaxis response regulator CheY
VAGPGRAVHRWRYLDDGLPCYHGHSKAGESESGRFAVDQTSRSILIVDDDSFVRVAVREVLDRSGYRLLEAGDGEEAMRVMELEQPGMVFLDLLMPKKSGLELLAEARARFPDSRVVVLSSFHSPSLEEDALRLGAAGFIVKPFHPLEIREAVESVLGSMTS